MEQVSHETFCFFTHLQAATFTPAGLRTMGSLRPGAGRGGDIVTFCTYTLLDFEVHSTPLASGGQPNYSFTSRYALTARDLGRLGGQGSRVRVELHQAVGGVQFVTHGSGQMSLMAAMERRAERMGGRVNITGEWCWIKTLDLMLLFLHAVYILFLWCSYLLHNAVIALCLIICLFPRLRGWNYWGFGFLGAPVSSCRACRHFGRERSWQANGHTPGSCASLSWLARYWTWGEKSDHILNYVCQLIQYSMYDECAYWRIIQFIKRTALTCCLCTFLDFSNMSNNKRLCFLTGVTWLWWRHPQWVGGYVGTLRGP